MFVNVRLKFPLYKFLRCLVDLQPKKGILRPDSRPSRGHPSKLLLPHTGTDTDKFLLPTIEPTEGKALHYATLEKTKVQHYATLEKTKVLIPTLEQTQLLLPYSRTEQANFNYPTVEQTRKNAVTPFQNRPGKVLLPTPEQTKVPLPTLKKTGKTV